MKKELIIKKFGFNNYFEFFSDEDEKEFLKQIENFVQTEMEKY